MQTIFKKMKKMMIRAMEMSQFINRVIQKEAIRKPIKIIVFLILQKLNRWSITKYPAVISWKIKISMLSDSVSKVYARYRIFLCS